MINITVIGDYNEAYANHINTDQAIVHAAYKLSLDVSVKWMATDNVDESALQNAHVIWCAPGSPYKSMEGALTAIRFARENNVPFIGTCGGFQHAVIEYARNVMGLIDAEHAEYNPHAQTLVITPLECSVSGQSLEVMLCEGSLARESYGRPITTEQYHCRYGINPHHRSAVVDENMVISGIDRNGAVRILELRDNDFFVATLFLPQSVSTDTIPHPLIMQLLRAAITYNKTKGTLSI